VFDRWYSQNCNVFVVEVASLSLSQMKKRFETLQNAHLERKMLKTAYSVGFL
jgi:hypothetical protein